MKSQLKELGLKDVFEKDNDGWTILHHACRTKNSKLARHLIEYFPDLLKIRDKTGKSPFLISGLSGSVELVNYLISRGFDLIDKDNNGETVLHKACSEGKMELVQYLVEDYPDMLTIRDKKGQSPFLVTGFSGSVELVKYLISQGCDVMDKDDDGQTVLHYACNTGQLELAQYLPDNYPDMLTIRDKLGQSPFLHSGFSGSVELVKYLIFRGSDVYDKDNDGWTILHEACKEGKLELVQYLVENYPDMLTIRDKSGQSPFLVTGTSGSVELVEYLISRGLDVFDNDNNGRTILHYANQNKKKELKQFLVRNYPGLKSSQSKSDCTCM